MRITYKKKSRLYTPHTTKKKNLGVVDTPTNRTGIESKSNDTHNKNKSFITKLISQFNPIKSSYFYNSNNKSIDNRLYKKTPTLTPTHNTYKVRYNPHKMNVHSRTVKHGRYRQKNISKNKKGGGPYLFNGIFHYKTKNEIFTKNDKEFLDEIIKYDFIYEYDNKQIFNIVNDIKTFGEKIYKSDDTPDEKEGKDEKDKKKKKRSRVVMSFEFNTLTVSLYSGYVDLFLFFQLLYNYLLDIYDVLLVDKEEYKEQMLAEHKRLKKDKIESIINNPELYKLQKLERNYDELALTKINELKHTLNIPIKSQRYHDNIIIPDFTNFNIPDFTNFKSLTIDNDGDDNSEINNNENLPNLPPIPDITTTSVLTNSSTPTPTPTPISTPALTTGVFKGGVVFKQIELTDKESIDYAMIIYNINVYKKQIGIVKDILIRIMDKLQQLSLFTVPSWVDKLNIYFNYIKHLLSNLSFITYNFGEKNNYDGLDVIFNQYQYDKNGQATLYYDIQTRDHNSTDTIDNILDRLFSNGNNLYKSVDIKPNKTWEHSLIWDDEKDTVRSDEVKYVELDKYGQEVQNKGNPANAVGYSEKFNDSPMQFTTKVSGQQNASPTVNSIETQNMLKDLLSQY